MGARRVGARRVGARSGGPKVEPRRVGPRRMVAQNFVLFFPLWGSSRGILVVFLKTGALKFGESVHFRPVGENNALRGGDQRLLRGVCVGRHERSGAAIFLTPDSVKRGTRIAKMMDTRDGIACSVQRVLEFLGN